MQILTDALKKDTKGGVPWPHSFKQQKMRDGQHGRRYLTRSNQPKTVADMDTRLMTKDIRHHTTRRKVHIKLTETGPKPTGKLNE